MVQVKNPKESTSTRHELFGSLVDMGHEQVMFCNDPATGLKAIIGIHNTTLGPALGGTRMWEYASDADALTDVLRLSRGMTFKAAISGLNLGGGKAVILANPREKKSEAFMRRFGQFVNNLNGKYITAEDVGTTTQYMEYIRMETPHVTGIPVSMGGSGDPSPVTAYGTYLGIKASMFKLTGSSDLSGKSIMVQGVGNVGYYLCELLNKENAHIFVFDIFEDKIKRVVDDFGVIPVKEEEVYTKQVDVYAPCALGATVNETTIPLFNCAIIAGAANNILKDEIVDAERLKDRGIIYAPDFVINAGGLMNVYTELEGYKRERAMAKADNIYDTTLEIFDFADKNGITTSVAAMELAKKRLREVGANRLYR